MKILWTKSNLPLSRFIRWGLKESCSHVVIVFDDKIVFHSNLLGTHIEWFATFKKTVTVVHEKEYKLPLEQEEVLYQNVIDKDDQKAYDYKAFAYFIWRAFLFRVFKSPFPAVNAWGSKDGFLCTGLASQLPAEFIPGLEKVKDGDMVSPEQLWLLLNKSTK